MSGKDTGYFQCKSCHVLMCPEVWEEGVLTCPYCDTPVYAGGVALIATQTPRLKEISTPSRETSSDILSLRRKNRNLGKGKGGSYTWRATNVEEEEDAEPIKWSGSKQARKMARGGGHVKWLSLYAFLAVGVLVFIILGLAWNKKNKQQEEVEKITSLHEYRSRDEIEEFIKNEINECHKVLGSFLWEDVVEGRGDYIALWRDYAGKMESYYGLVSMPAYRKKIETKLEWCNAFPTQKGTVIEVLWQKEEGDMVESVFHNEKGKWKLDWAHFERYSSSLWPLFLSQVGDSSGEFRVYVKYTETGALEKDGMVTVRFVAPKASRSGQIESSLISPPVRVPKGSELGNRLQDILESREPRGPLQFFKRDPIGWYRVRVKLAWEKKEGEFYLEPTLQLKEIAATNWLSKGFEGIKIPDKAEGK